jgi:hypothetical protein
MALNSVNPYYATYLEDWKLVRAAYRGERAIKQEGTTYLPATAGMIADGQGGPNVNAQGYKDYNAYKLRAIFPDHIAMAVEFYIGLLHKRETQIKLPKVMEPLLEKASEQGDTLLQMLRKINEQQLVTGRCGILADFPETPTLKQVLPNIALYLAEAIVNWDEGPVEQNEERQLKLCVLNESEHVRIPGAFEWTTLEKYRVLALGNVVPPPEGVAPSTQYRSGLFIQDKDQQLVFNEAAMKEPSIRGKTLDEIPFVMVNTKDLAVNPDDPPLLGLARLCLAIYRGEADYRQNLFMQGQDTLVVINGKTPLDGEVIRTGAGQRIDVKHQGDAKYIGVSSNGLPEQRQALENLYRQADDMAGKVIDTRSKEKESGEALQTRMGAQTATLNQIAKTGAAGLQKLLRIMATWLGANPDEVEVTPNLEFADGNLSADDFSKLISAKSAGLPLSEESLHALLKDNGFTAMTYEDEVSKVEGEPPRGQLAVMIENDLVVPGAPKAKGDTPPKKPGAKGNGPTRSTRKPPAER